MRDLTVFGMEILECAADCFTKARSNILEGASYLYKISNERLYVGVYSSFGEFVENKCQISTGMASKLIKIYEHYVIQNRVSQVNLQGIDHEKLYLAIGLPKKVEDQLASAQTWTRDELKSELKEERSECKEHHPITICAKCHQRLEVN